MPDSGIRLMETVAGLSVPQRLSALALRARRSAGTPEFDRLLRDLSDGGRYERRTAIYLATVAGERNHLLIQADSEDPDDVGRALAALIRLGVEPGVVVDRLPRLSRRARQAVRRALAHGDRARLADAMLPRLRALFGDGEAAQVLPFCSSAVVTDVLAELAYAVPSWATLGRRHIDAVFDHIGSRAADAGTDDWRELWPWLTANVTAAAGHDPARLLALAAQAVAHVPISSLRPVAGVLARGDAAAVDALIRHPSGNGRGMAGPAAWRALRTLSDDRLTELYLACGHHDRRRFLRAMPPSRRTAVIGPVLMRPGIAPGEVDMFALDALPRLERAALARELLARPGGAEVPEVADRLTARLPWAEAKPLLAEAIRRPVAEERARAYPLLVAAAAGGRDPAVLGELLDLLRRLRNEQDPVRRTALHALTTVPVTLFENAQLPGLEQLATDALQARDRSYQTASTVGVLARMLLLRAAQTGDAAFTDTALLLMARLADSSISVNLTGLHRNLAPGMEHRLFAALRPRLIDDAARDRWELSLELADGLWRRAYDIPELQRLVLRASAAHNDSTVRRAVRLALDNPATRDAYLDEMLRRDRSLIVLPQVQAQIARRRTDLLDTVLSEATPGRFLSTRIRFVPMFPGGFDRWSPRHIDRYARLLDSYARSPRASVSERTSAVRQLGLLPGGVERLLPYLDTADLPVAEAALTALGRSDEPERAIAVLVRYVGDDRARVAVSSIVTCAYAISPTRLGTTLGPLLDSPKITAVKEGVRLLATLHAPDAMPIIGALWNRPDLHRDIRRAAVFATRWLLDHDGAWQLLGEAAADPEVAGAILDIPPALLPIPQRERFAIFLRDLAASPDHRVAGQALDALARWYRWAPPDTGEVLLTRLTDLSELGLWTTALRTLLAGVAVNGDPAALTAAVDRLRAAETTVMPDRDLPARQRLSTTVQWLSPTLRDYDIARPAAAPVIAGLIEDPLWHEQVIELTLAAIRWTEPERTVAAIDALSVLAIGALIDHPADRLVTSLTHDLGRTPLDALASIATGLAATPAVPTALAAVAMIARCGTEFGWAAPWPDLLTGLRTHPDIDVRRAALAIYTAPE
ncbi:hypothetical protein [Nocardia sp. NPDC051570]|uniref:hypothetical protein n=1 Tax=Nocardia sp. NPDC051570 TaxID=3364324 RepID=UPI0037AA2832